jgi:hypothetical protein
MHRTIPAVTAILATVLLTLARPQLPPQQQTLETIGGIVVSSNTNQPLPQTRVELTREDYARRATGFEKPCKPQPDAELTTARHFVSTDTNGKFKFDSVVPGRYYLTAEREGYLKAEYGQKGAFSVGTVLTIGPQPVDAPVSPDSVQRELGLLGVGGNLQPAASTLPPPQGGLGQRQQGLTGGAASAIPEGPPGAPSNLLQDLKLSMIPAPTISGKVFQERGGPLVAAAVQAYAFRYTPLNGRTLKSIRATLTNDEGLYRLFWLDPGRYVIAAGYSSYGLQPWTSGLKFTPNLPNPDTGLPMMFYAVGTNATDAQVVRLNPGSEPLADFRLRERRRFTARIQIVGDSVPQSAALVFVPRGGDLCAALDYGITSKDGRFEIRDVPEGIYLAGAINGRDFISDLITIKVESGQANETLLPVVPPTQIWGNVYIDAPPGLEIGPTRVNITRARQELSQVALGKVESLSATVGSFTIPGLGPGTYYVSMDLPPGFYVDNMGASRRDPDNPDQCSANPSMWSPQFSYMDFHGHLNPTEPFTIPGVIPASAECLAIKVRYGRLITGFVFDRLRMPVTGALVVAIPRSVWSKTDDAGVTPPDRYLTATTDSTGYFEIHGATESLSPVKGELDNVSRESPAGTPPGSRGRAPQSPTGAVPAAPQEYHVYVFESLDPNLIYAPDLSDRFRNREPYVLRQEERDTVWSPWMVRKIERRTIVDPSSCPGQVAPTARQYCLFTSIPAEDTAEIQ